MADLLYQDVRLAWRGLRRSKGFFVAAVLTLALGMAGVTVMFALVRGVLLRPMPVTEPDRVLVAWRELRASGYAHYPFGSSEIEGVARASRLLESLAGVTSDGVDRVVTFEEGAASHVQVAVITGELFDVLGVRPVLGRTLDRREDIEGAEKVVVISHGLWQRRYGGSPDVLGRRIVLGDDSLTIVGVMPPTLDYPRGVEAWRSAASFPSDGPFGDAARREVDLVARMREGVTIEQATAELTTLLRQIEQEAPPGAPRGLFPIVRSLNDVTVGDVRPAMLTLLGAVGFVLLIACANVANLMLFRGAARHGESAVRVALGASRVRIARERLAEAALVAAAAAVVALVVAWGMLDAVVALVPGGLPRVDSIRVDAAVVWFTFAIALVTTVLSGVAPALASVRADLVSALRSHAVKTAGRTGERGRRILVVAQVAMAVMVIAGTGLLIRSVLALQAVDVGIAVDGLAFVGLSMPQAKYADRARHEQFLDEAIAALESTREIRGATPVNVPPFSGPTGWDVPRFTVEGQSADAAAANPGLNLEAIHPNYFETLQVPLVRGRAFTRFDRAGAENVAIVSDEVARRMWPGGDAIGKRLKMGAPSSPGRWYIVVGVAASTRYRDLVRTRPTLYLPAAQFLVTAQTLIVRTNAGADAVLRIAREKLGAIDADVRVVEVAPYSRMLDAPLARPRFNALLLSAFGTAALLLAAIGLYAVMSVYVRQRDREIGLRVALGATPRDVRRLVIAEGARLASAGALIGVAGATIAARLLEGMLFAVEPLDPLALGGAALLLVAVAAVAAYLPVRRAARVDPIIALRSI